MSVQTLYTAATGMESLETKLDVIANNLANINTVGFKRDRANFEDLFYRQIRLPGADESGTAPTATGIELGLGSRVSSTQTDFDQGSFQTTGNHLDLAIEGNGFLQVEDPNGDPIYTRSGNLNLNANGELVVGSASTGRRVLPSITIPPDATNISISPSGVVEVQVNNQFQQLGTLQLATFINPDGLLKLGDNLFRQTSASGAATLNDAGINGTGVIRQGALEA